LIFNPASLFFAQETPLAPLKSPAHYQERDALRHN
jgi:hypothetical protein